MLQINFIKENKQLTLDGLRKKNFKNHNFINSFLAILFITFSLVNSFGQSSFSIKTKSIDPTCSLNNGIIKIETNAIQPTFTWSTGVSYSDSIAYNLSPGTYTVQIKDINNLIETRDITLINDTINCAEPPIPTFQISNLSEGIIKINTPYSDKYQIKCELSDGTIYTDIYTNILHKFTTTGNYSVCITLTNKIGSRSQCSNIYVPTWSNNISGKNISLPTITPYNLNYLPKIIGCGGKVYFLDYNPNPRKIYAFDEATKQTTQLPFDEVSFYSSTACLNNKLYFGAKIGNSGFELCETDGTILGSKITSNYVSSPNLGVQPKNLIVLNNILYFDGDLQIDYNGSSQYLFKYDGNSITRFDNLGSYGIPFPRVFNNKIIHLYGLTLFDGTNYTNLLPNDRFSVMFDVIDNKMIFINYNNLGTNLGTDSELWSTDGTLNGTTRIKDIRPGISRALTSEFYFKFNNKIYFVGNDGINGSELWVTDGTESGTYMFKDFTPGSTEVFQFGNFTEFNGKFYFSNNEDFWESDGTQIGTKRVLNNGIPIRINQNKGLNIYQDVLFFEPLPNISERGMQYLKPDNSISDFHDEGSPIEYSIEKALKLPNGSSILIGFIDNIRCLFDACNYTFPNISSKIAYYGEYNTFVAPLGSSAKWYNTSNYLYNYITPASTASIYQFYTYGNSKTFKVKLKDANGCESIPKIINVNQFLQSSVVLDKIQRCNLSSVKAKFKIIGHFDNSNVFKILIGPELNLLQEVPYTNINGDIYFNIPIGLQNIQILKTVVSSTKPVWTDFKSADILMPQNSNNAFFVGNKTILIGENANLNVLMDGIPPYSFNINSTSYNNITNNPFVINLSPNVTTIYNLSNFQNSCGNGNIRKSTVNIQVSACVNSINQSGVLLDGIFKSFGSLISNGSLEQNKNLLYNSESAIQLNPGFVANTGSKFKAEIKNCN